MTFVPFKGFGKYGVVHDSPDEALPLGVWSNARNIRFSGIQMEKMLEPTIAALWDTETNGDPLWLQGWADGLSTYWAVATANRIFVLRRSGQNSVGEWQDVTRASGQYLFGQWQSFAWGNTVIFNNGRDVPQIFNQDTFRFEDLPKWGLISSVEDLTNNAAPTRQVEATCTHLYPLKSFLVASGVTENGLYQPNKIWWSDATALATFKDVGDKQGPPSWDYESPSTLSAQSEIAPESGAIRTAELLNDNLIIYTDAAATALSVVGGANVMASRRLFNKGAASLHSVCEFNNQHFCVSQDQIYIHDGSTVKLIAKDRVEEEFFTRIGKGGRFGDGQVEWALLQAVKNPDRKEIIITYGALGEDIPVNIPDNYSIATGAVQALPATASGTVVVLGVICKEYECDALDKAIRAMNPVSYYPMTSGQNPVPSPPGLVDAVGNTNIWQASGNAVVGDTYPGALDSCNGFGFHSVGTIYDTGLAGDTPARPDYNSGSKEGMMIATWRTQNGTDQGTGGRYEIQWGEAIQVVSIKGMISGSVTLLITAKNSAEPPDILESVIALPSTDGTNTGGTGVLLSWTYNEANQEWIDVKLYDQLGNVVHDRTYNGALNNGLVDCYRAAVNIDKSSMQYFAWRDTAATQDDVDAFVQAFAQNQSDYVDPDPNCIQPVCKEYECDAYGNFLLAQDLFAHYPMTDGFTGVDISSDPGDSTPGTGSLLYDRSGNSRDMTSFNIESFYFNWEYLGSRSCSGTSYANSYHTGTANWYDYEDYNAWPFGEKGVGAIGVVGKQLGGNTVNILDVALDPNESAQIIIRGNEVEVTTFLSSNVVVSTSLSGAPIDADGFRNVAVTWDSTSVQDKTQIAIYVDHVLWTSYEQNGTMYRVGNSADYVRILTHPTGGMASYETWVIKGAGYNPDNFKAAWDQSSPDYVDPNPNCVPAGQAQTTKTPRRKDDPPTIQIPRRPGRDII